MRWYKMRIFTDDALRCYRQKFDGIWFYLTAEGTKEEMYEHLKQDVIRVNSDPMSKKYKLKIYRITQVNGLFVLWKSIHSAHNITTRPDVCVHQSH